MLKKHFQTQHPKNFQFYCPTCHEEFRELGDVNNHMAKHLRNLFECSVCLKRLNSKAQLHNHYAKEHPKSDRSVCSICNKKFADPGGLAKHRFIHTGIRPYFCPFCFKTFNLKSCHINHVRRHMNFQPYKCEICQKSFYSSGDLRKHIRLHTGEKPYCCKICNNRFRLKDVLNVHMKTHAKIRPFKCFQCSKAFKSRALLRYHVSIHSGIQSFLCPVCPKKYYAMISLRAHIRKTHITKDLKCQICGVFEGHRFYLVDHLISHRNTMVPIIEPVSRGRLEDITSVTVKKKRGRPKKNTSKSSPLIGCQLKTRLPRVSKKGMKKRNFNDLNKKLITDSKHDQTNVVDCSNRQSNDININTSIGEPDISHEIIEIVENIKVEIPEDDVQLSTVVVEQCLICLAMFSTHQDLIEHVYVHI